MKPFLKRLLIFLLPILALYSVLEFKLSQMPNNFKLKKEYFENQLSEIEILTTGSSYGNSINPQFLSRHAFNLFNDGEDFYYDAQIIEKYLDRMPNLKLIIIPISYFSLEYRMDRSPVAWRVPFYKFVWDIPPREFTSYFNAGFFSYTAAYGWKEAVGFIQNGFTSADNLKLLRNGWKEIEDQEISESPEWERAGWQYVSLNETLMNEEAVEVNVGVLSRLIKTSQIRQIKVLLITPPAYHYYYDHIDPIKYQRMQAGIHQLVNIYQVIYVNFLKDARFTASDFYNPDHVSTRGSMKFSQLIDKEIIQPLLGRNG